MMRATVTYFRHCPRDTPTGRQAFQGAFRLSFPEFYHGAVDVVMWHKMATRAGRPVWSAEGEGCCTGENSAAPLQFLWPIHAT
jgi:hypothetical protein